MCEQHFLRAAQWTDFPFIDRHMQYLIFCEQLSERVFPSQPIIYAIHFSLLVDGYYNTFMLHTVMFTLHAYVTIDDWLIVTRCTSTLQETVTNRKGCFTVLGKVHGHESHFTIHGLCIAYHNHWCWSIYYENFRRKRNSHHSVHTCEGFGSSVCGTILRGRPLKNCLVYSVWLLLKERETTYSRPT